MVEAALDLVVAIRKVDEPWGWLGNMSPHAVMYKDQNWPRAESLFQALRFDVPSLQEKLRAQTNPMKAKMLAKKYRRLMVVTPRSEQDLRNMRMILRLKVQQHPWMGHELRRSGDALIVEDCSKRKGGSGKFWGAALQDGQWVGENMLGKLWMEVRAELAGSDQKPS